MSASSPAASSQRESRSTRAASSSAARAVGGVGVVEFPAELVDALAQGAVAGESLREVLVADVGPGGTGEMVDELGLRSSGCRVRRKVADGQGADQGFTK